LIDGFARNLRNGSAVKCVFDFLDKGDRMVYRTLSRNEPECVCLYDHHFRIPVSLEQIEFNLAEGCRDPNVIPEVFANDDLFLVPEVHFD
jgi:hypothetical protein